MVAEAVWPVVAGFNTRGALRRWVVLVAAGATLSDGVKARVGGRALLGEGGAWEGAVGKDTGDSKRGDEELICGGAWNERRARRPCGRPRQRAGL